MQSTFEIFEDEIKAGLSEKIKASASIKFISDIQPIKSNLNITEELIKFFKAKSNKQDFDLFPLTDVMASTGWNDNDDIFTKEELWASRHTPEDKPFNLEHVDTDIIGHIIANQCFDKDFNLIDIDTDIKDVPDVFHLVTSSVMYRNWDDEERAEAIAQIIQEITDGQKDVEKAIWKVSMECLFSGFNYAAIAKNGEMSIIERNKQTAFLTKHLKAYGGNGVYNNCRIGRLLKNMTFSGKGLTKTPANEYSVILKAGASSTFIPKYTGRTIMDSEKIIAELKSSVDKLTVERDTLNKQMAENKEKAISEKIVALQTELDSANKNSKDLAEKLAKAENANKDLATANTKYVEQLADLESKAKVANRVSKLVEAGLSKDDATAQASKFEKLDDTLFDSVVQLAGENVKAKKEVEEAKAAAAAKKPETKEETKPVDKTVAAKDEKVEVEETTEEAEAALNDINADDKLISTMAEILNSKNKEKK